MKKKGIDQKGKNQKWLIMAMLGCSVLLSACAQYPLKPALMVGNDRDVHGCIASAGYAWCGQENACVRPWELAKAKGFDFASDGFKQYCAGQSLQTR